jgi:hypothetical protein
MLVIGLGAMIILATGCAKAPQMEIDNAKASLEAAKVAEANRYLPAEFNALQDSLSSALNLVEEQNSKFALFRNYKTSKSKLESVVTMASEVKENANIRKEEVKNEVQNTLTETMALVEEVKVLITKAPRGKEGKAAIEAIQGDLAIVEASLAEVTTLINNGDYLTAQDKVNAAMQKAMDLKMELEEVIAKVRK